MQTYIDNEVPLFLLLFDSRLNNHFLHKKTYTKLKIEVEKRKSGWAEVDCRQNQQTFCKSLDVFVFPTILFFYRKAECRINLDRTGEKEVLALVDTFLRPVFRDSSLLAEATKEFVLLFASDSETDRREVEASCRCKQNLDCFLTDTAPTKLTVFARTVPTLVVETDVDFVTFVEKTTYPLVQRADTVDLVHTDRVLHATLFVLVAPSFLTEELLRLRSEQNVFVVAVLVDSAKGLGKQMGLTSARPCLLRTGRTKFVLEGEFTQHGLADFFNKFVAGSLVPFFKSKGSNTRAVSGLWTVTGEGLQELATAFACSQPPKLALLYLAYGSPRCAELLAHVAALFLHNNVYVGVFDLLENESALFLLPAKENHFLELTNDTSECVQEAWKVKTVCFRYVKLEVQTVTPLVVYIERRVGKAVQDDEL